MTKAQIEALLICGITRVAYDFTTQRAVLHVPGMNCTDMTGCIQWVTSLDEAVREIRVINDDPHDESLYVRQHDGTWKSVLRG